MSSGTKYYGIYRATVVNNIDPEFLGRINVIVPAVGGVTPSTWALPSIPLAGKQMGAYMVPQLGSAVWVQFEAGDPDYPVWVGGFWGTGEVPALALAGIPADPNITIQSALQNSITISDVPGPIGGIILKSATGATIIVNDTGIYIQNGKGASIVMVGPSVTVNAGALVVI